MAASAAPPRRARPGDGRVWRPAGTAPLPKEPGRVVVVALLQAARVARGRRTAGDDRLETSVYAVKRFLYRQGHAEKSGRFARSTEQLVAGLAPVMGWGRMPPPKSAERARFFRRHRASVQRWLGWLVEAELIEVEAETDNQGYWWRVVITLQAPAPPSSEALAASRTRLRGWARRDSRRRARWKPPKRSLAAIRRRSQAPNANTRACGARQRAFAAHERRRRCAVEQAVALAQERRRGDETKDLRHPYGAPPTSARPAKDSTPLESFETFEARAQSAPHSAQTSKNSQAFAAGTGAHTREAPSATAANPPANPGKACTEKEGPRPAVGSPEFDAWLLARVARREQETSWRREEAARQALQRATEVSAWHAGHGCPFGRLREAWVVFRHGAARVGEAGSGAAGARRPGQEQLAARALALYEAYAEHRPPGWPASGAGALTVLASQQRAGSLAGDVARLLILAKGMRGVALERDPQRLEQLRRRAERRAAPPAPSRLQFRLKTPPRFYEDGEQLRERLRDDLLLAGEDPGRWPNCALAEDAVLRLHADASEQNAQPAPRHGWEHAENQRLLREAEARTGSRRSADAAGGMLDGLAARAERFRRELAAGIWRVPEAWTA